MKRAYSVLVETESFGVAFLVVAEGSSEAQTKVEQHMKNNPDDFSLGVGRCTVHVTDGDGADVCEVFRGYK